MMRRAKGTAGRPAKGNETAESMQHKTKLGDLVAHLEVATAHGSTALSHHRRAIRKPQRERKRNSPSKRRALTALLPKCSQRVPAKTPLC